MTGAGRTWERLAWTALGLGVVYVMGCLYRLAFTFHEASTLVSLLTNRPADAMDQIDALQNTEESLSMWVLAALLAAFAAYGFFLRKTRQTLVEEGVPRATLRHWGIAAWRIAVAVNLLVSLALRSAFSPDANGDLASVEDSIRQQALLTEISMVVRVITMGALIVGILGLRTRVKAGLAAAEERRRLPVVHDAVAS